MKPSSASGPVARGTEADHAGAPSRRRERGQVLVFFVVAIFVIIGLIAVVIDVAWYWSNTLEIQRAADAAALAGAPRLPNDPAGAFTLAFNEATKNGYTTGGGTVVTPSVDPTNNRRLRVSVKANVGTFFMRIFGIASLPATRTAIGEFTLPVPMGSPQNFYGVGTFEYDAAAPAVTPAYSGGAYTPYNWNPGTQASITTAAAAAGDGQAATYANLTGTIGSDSQIWRGFGVTLPAGATVTGVTVEVVARAGSGNTTCQLRVDLSSNVTAGAPVWRSGAPGDPITLGTTYPAAPQVLGGAGVNWGQAWTAAQVTGGNFGVRLVPINPGAGCSDSAGWFVDSVQVRVHYTAPARTTVTSSLGGFSDVTTQGFWAAVFTRGGIRQEGDRYSPAFFDPGGGTNPDFDPAGYDYVLEYSGGATNGSVDLFDPMFCGVGDNRLPGAGAAGPGWLGAGDHWTTQPSGGGRADPTIEYRLYNENNTPYDPSDDTLLATQIYGGNARPQTDQGGSFGTPQVTTGADDCSANPAHNQWVGLGSGLAAGRYRLNVRTSDPANAGIGAENLFSIHVASSGGIARVYGNGRMAAYTNLTGAAGGQDFYLAQIGAQYKNKTLQIDLFDPGDVGGNATLFILSPDGNSYNNVTFSYQADGQCVNGRSDSCSGNGSRPSRPPWLARGAASTTASSRSRSRCRPRTAMVGSGRRVRPRTAGGRSTTWSAWRTTRPPGP